MIKVPTAAATAAEAPEEKDKKSELTLMRRATASV